MSPRSLAADVTCCHWLPAPAVTEEPGMVKEQPLGRKPDVNQRWLLRLRVQMESEYGWTDLGCQLLFSNGIKHTSPGSHAPCS
jgi:hypothetical protein